jgi:hypothetical protein
MEENQPIVPLATVRNFEDLRLALRDRVEWLNVSRNEINFVSGLHHAEKILAGQKRVGPTSMEPLLTTLGVKLILVPDDEAAERYTSRLTRRAHIPRMPTGTVLTQRRRRRRAKAANPHRGDSSWGKRMAAMRQLKLTRLNRTKVARIAAKARWRGKTG